MLCLEIFNGVALLAISMHPRFGRHAFAGPAILSGATIFSSTIMALVLNRDRCVALYRKSDVALIL